MKPLTSKTRFRNQKKAKKKSKKIKRDDTEKVLIKLEDTRSGNDKQDGDYTPMDEKSRKIQESSWSNDKKGAGDGETPTSQTFSTVNLHV